MNKPLIDKNGIKYWFDQQDRLHREDGPAIDCANGTKEWYQDGIIHRDDGPAIERADGDKYWYQQGKLHRENGPAVENANGSKEWWIKGEQLNVSSQEEFERLMRLKSFW